MSIGKIITLFYAERSVEMNGWIAFGVTLSIFVAYIVIVKLEWELVDVWDILMAIFWPITLLVWLVRRPTLKPMWVFIGRGLAPIGGAIVSLLVPVLTLIHRLFSWWLEHWPESKRGLIGILTPIAFLWPVAAILAWRDGDIVWAIIFTSMVVAAIVTILVTYFRSRLEAKQVNSS